MTRIFFAGLMMSGILVQAGSGMYGDEWSKTSDNHNPNHDKFQNTPKNQ